MKLVRDLMWLSWVGAGRLALLVAVAGGVTHAQSSVSIAPDAIELHIDAGIASQIDALQAIDDHAHPVLPPPNDRNDRDFDALPVDNMEADTDIAAWRPSNPQLPAAWKALWGFDGAAPLDAEQTKQLQAARDRVKAREGQHYDEWILDQADIGAMLANRVTLGAGLAEPRFRWVPYVDALLFPLDNSGIAEATPDRKLFFAMEDKLRAKYLHAVGLTSAPPTLEEYLAKVVTPTLERQRRTGAVAEKFEVAYLRGLDFGNPSKEQAEQVYTNLSHQSRPDTAEYKLLQDFLFRYIAGECGRLGMAVHLHIMAGGGGYFDVAQANPLLLEPVLDDPRLRGTRFVLLHGGWPFVREAGALLQKPNVYLDLSQETISFSPRTLSGWLREWLETYPDKVMFGTDAYPYSDVMGWEESALIASRNGREALGLALTGMLDDREISRQRAGQIAMEVMRGTAARLYAYP